MFLQLMSFEELSGMISSVIELGKAAVALKDVPVEQRKHYRDIIDETYSLLDSALMLLIRRLGDLLLIAEKDKAKFADELKRLDNFQEWEQLERNVRLCRPLREAAAEMDSLQTKLKNKISLKDQQTLQRLINYVLRQGEASLAEFLSRSLYDLASIRLEEPGKASEVYNNAVAAVRKKRDELKLERRKLIESQIRFIDTI